MLVITYGLLLGIVPSQLYFANIPDAFSNFLFQDKSFVCMRASLRDRGNFCSLDYEFQSQGWVNIHTNLQQKPELSTPLPNNFPLPKWVPIPGCYGNSADSLYSQNKHAFSEMYT